MLKLKRPNLPKTPEYEITSGQVRKVSYHENHADWAWYRVGYQFPVHQHSPKFTVEIYNQKGDFLEERELHESFMIGSSTFYGYGTRDGDVIEAPKPKLTIKEALDLPIKNSVFSNVRAYLCTKIQHKIRADYDDMASIADPLIQAGVIEDIGQLDDWIQKAIVSVFEGSMD